jgi:hypothetical protein
MVIICGDNPYTHVLELNKQVYYYGISDDNDIQARNIEYRNDGTSFDVFIEDEYYGHFDLPLFGRHMVLNALSVIILSYMNGLNMDEVHDSIKSFKAKAKDIIRMCYPWNLEQSIIKLNHLINGVGNYWKMGTNKKLFSKMDHYIYELWMRQIKRWHPNKSVRWRVNKYFKMSKHPGHNYKWTFTDPNTGIQVDMMYWIKIKYPRCIKYNATPYDSEYEDYFNEIKSIKPFEYLYG